MSVRRVRSALQWAREVYWTRRSARLLASYGPGYRATAATYVTRNVAVGEFVWFNGLRVSGRGRVVFGDNVHCGRNLRIICSNHNHHGELLPYDRVDIARDVRIESNTWLGDDVLVLGRDVHPLVRVARMVEEQRRPTRPHQPEARVPGRARGAGGADGVARVAADQDAHRVLLIEPLTNELLGVMGDGQPGVGPYKCEDPEGVAIFGNAYFFADSDNNRVVKYVVVMN